MSQTKEQPQDHLKTNTRTPEELKLEPIINALEIAADAINSMSSYIQDIINNYRRNEEKEANEKLGEFVEVVNLFVQLVTQIKNQHPNIHSYQEIINNTEAHLLESMQEMLTAKQNRDDTSLCDLLEYELGDNLEKWNSLILTPLLKDITS